MAQTTEEYVDAVFKHVSDKRDVDESRVILMGWSSSGPACYAVSLSKRKYITSYYVLMSVYNQKLLPPERNAKGNRYYIEHGKQDTVCKVWLARMTRNRLRSNGAAIEMFEHNGGHGFQGPVYPRMKKAFAWLTATKKGSCARSPGRPAPRAIPKATATPRESPPNTKRPGPAPPGQIVGWRVTYRVTPTRDGLIEVRTPIRKRRPKQTATD